MDLNSAPTTTAVPDRAITSFGRLQKLLGAWIKRKEQPARRESMPPPSQQRLQQSLSETPFDLVEYTRQFETKYGSVLYLAYGSNMSNEAFRGNRGIKPISQINVQVPSLRLTFDLPGIPYANPCYANTARRDPNNDPPPKSTSQHVSEKTPLISSEQAKSTEYHKDRWHKGLIGVVYEVSAEDYAHIIETEGGGSSYQDILVNCHPFDSQDPKAAVPTNPTSPAFKAHTLFAPATAPDEQPPKNGGRIQRPDMSYAQASPRYLKLLTDGADELQLPYEYQDYLHQLRPYRATTNEQRIGRFIFLSLWTPFILMVYAMYPVFRDEKGRAPEWMRQLSRAVLRAVWASYDAFFHKTFGDGERTVGDGGDDHHGVEENLQSRRQSLLGSWSSRAISNSGQVDEKADHRLV